MRKKIITIILSAAAVFLTFGGLKVTTASAGASAEIAMELETGTVLAESNADAKLPMASTTKVMTALIIAEDCNLDEEIIVADQAVGVEGSSIYLKKQEKIDVRDLLYGLMLRSGNDSATALAIHHSGSVEKFVEEMNARAKNLGAANTQFKNPSGLPADGHYTTARDLCNIARYAMKNPIFKKVVSTINHNGKYRNFTNKNKMLFKYDGANGVKTGYTVKAGRCLVSSAERGGMDVVTVVLNCPDMYERSIKILDGCFNNYKLLTVDENKVFMCGRVLCKLSKTAKFVVKNNEKLNYTVVSEIKDSNVRIGDLVAKFIVLGENGLLFSDYLYSIVNSK